MKCIQPFLKFIILILWLAACSSKGTVLIQETVDGTGCNIKYTSWSRESKCELSLQMNDTLQVEIQAEDGSIALVIQNLDGTESYSGKRLKTGIFTVTVPMTGTYHIHVSGKKATGQIRLQTITP